MLVADNSGGDGKAAGPCHQGLYHAISVISGGNAGGKNNKFIHCLLNISFNPPPIPMILGSKNFPDFVLFFNVNIFQHVKKQQTAKAKFKCHHT